MLNFKAKFELVADKARVDENSEISYFLKLNVMDEQGNVLTNKALFRAIQSQLPQIIDR